jgi:RNA polymerase sigma-70 factor (ECF subfamily)
LRVWVKAPGWRPGADIPDETGSFRPARFSTWLYRVVVNLSIDRKRRPGHAPLELAGETPDPAERADDLLARTELTARVAAAVSDLPERQRAALALCFYEGLSNREAAEILSLTPGAVESLLVRARRTLRLSLAATAAEFLEVGT